MQWAYLFERFPSFSQTFCYREVAGIERQGLAPWIFSIRRPRDEPGQDFPPGLVERVRYLPEEDELSDEFRWLRRCERLSEPLLAAFAHLKGTPDNTRFVETGWLGEQCRTLEVGHIHAHFAGLAARTAYWLRKYYGVSYSLTAHANDVFCPPADHLSVSLEELIRAARFVVTVSDFSVARLRERFPFAASKIFRVYNGIDTRAFPSAAPATSAPLIVSVGRCIEKKGFPDLIAACARLRDRGTDFRCKIVGEGPMQKELAAAIARANLGEQVELTGPKSMGEVAALLQSARVFALPCVEEADGGMDNLPTVIAEAMAARLPVVSTPIAGVPEMVVDGKTGLLVPPRSPARLADGLAQMLADPGRAVTLGRAGRSRALALFDIKKTTRGLKRLLLEQTKLPVTRDVLRHDPALLWLALQRRRAAS